MADFKGTLKGVTVASGGYVSAVNQGIVSGMDIQPGGQALAYNGAKTVSATVSGTLAVSSNAVLSTAHILSGGTVSARRGCTAKDIGVDGGRLFLYEYGEASNIGVGLGGSAFFAEMTSAEGIVLSSGASCTASSYVALSGVTVSEGGRLFLWANTSATDVTVESGGSLAVGSGCTAANVTSADGAVIAVSDGGHVEYAEQGGI